MTDPTPFHPRTAALCTSHRWKDWAGWAAVCSFESCHEAEYFAIRQAAGLLDVTPLFKLEIRGRDAAEFLSYVWTRDITKLQAGRVVYGCWCNDDGHVLDDGTITRLSATRFRMTSAEPAYAWLCERSRGFDIEIEDVTNKVCALALQGPTSREIIRDVFGDPAAKLGFFRGAEARLEGSGPSVYITRTGYTGDLGYELWLAPEHALAVWDSLMERGERHRMRPIGLDALDVARLEAGFLLCGVEYKSAKTARIPMQKSTPYELGLDWCVQLDREPFVGQAALRAEAKAGSKWKLVGLVADWDETEKLFEAVGLPPSLPAGAWRDGRPVYDGAQQVGRATSGTWSPTLKQNVALASVGTRYATPGTELRIEMTVEYERKTVRAIVTERPFFDPPRKKS